MTLRVNVENTISIGGNEYRIADGGNVHRVPTSQFAPKTVIGDVDGTSYPRTSVVRWNDWRGGIGLAEFDGNEGIRRNKFSFLQTGFKDHLVMMRLITTTANDPADGASFLGEHNSVIYCAFAAGTDVYAYNNGTNNWDDKLHDLPAAVTDVLSSFRMGGSEYTAWATTGGYTYTSDGSSFTDDTTDTKYLAFWDDRLWGIDNTGQLWFASTIGTETNDAQLPLADGFVTSLFVGPDATGEKILYAGTKVGLYAHDAPNARFIETELHFAEHPNGSISAKQRGGLIYVPMGQSLLEYDPRTGNYRNIGPDNDDGVPGALYEDSFINSVVVTPRELFISTAATADNGFVAKWDGAGWEMWNSFGAAGALLHASDAYGSYRLWTAVVGVDVQHTQLFASEVNPDDNGDMSYHASVALPINSLDTPWFTAGETELSKLALRLQIETANPTSSETVEILYAIDYAAISLTADTNFTSTGTITTSGLTTFTFQTGGEDKGLEFRAIKFRVKLARGATTTNTPDMRSLTLEYRKKLPTTWGTTVTLDCRERIGNRSPETQLAELRTAVEANLMQQVVWRDRDDNEENYFMDITNMEIVEATGNNYESIVRITASEN